MGSQIQTPENSILAQYAPPLQQYKVKYCGINYYVWEHSLQNSSLIQFSTNIDEYLLKQHIDIFMFRHRHNLLVSTQYLRRNQNSNKISVFYERVFTNLSRIRDLPFQDSLQFYYVGLRGFQALYRRFGFFQIQENMFHITKNSRVKVWCHKDISKIKPLQSQINKSTSKKKEQQMVKKIIRIIDQNSDLSGNPYPIGSTLYKQASSSFMTAIQRLRDICSKQKFIIQEKLICLDVIGGGQVGNLLDQYGQIRQNPISIQFKEEQTKNPTIKSNLQILVTNENKNRQVNQQINEQNKKVFQDQSRLKTRKKSKGKGLKVSHSLQKLNDKVKDELAQVQGLKQSPIKGLQIGYINTNSSSQPFYPINRNLHPALTPPKMSQQNNPVHLIRCNPQNNAISNINFRSGPIIQSGDPLIRRNSIDYHARGPQYHNPHQQYKIIINYIPRPSSVVSKTHPPTQIITNQNAKPVSPSNYTFSRLKHQQNLRNIKNAYLRTEKTLTTDKNSDQRAPNYQVNKAQTPAVPNYMRLGQKENNIKEQKYIPNYQSANYFNQRATFINKLNQINKNCYDFKVNGNYGLNEIKKEPTNDYSNIKDRFQQYKKGFNYQRKQTRYDPKYQKQYTHSTTPYFLSQNHDRSNLAVNSDLNKLTPKPFFAGILKVDTVTSCIDSNGFSLQKQQSSIVKNEPLSINKTISKKYSDIPVIMEFPSNTDISDNASSVPTNNHKGISSNETTGKSNEPWREQSVVINHDPNGSMIKMPDKKKYMANIDSDIWADMQRVQQRQKQMSMKN